MKRVTHARCSGSRTTAFRRVDSETVKGLPYGVCLACGETCYLVSENGADERRILPTHDRRFDDTRALEAWVSGARSWR